MVGEALLHDLHDSPDCTKARICLQLKGVSYRRVPPSLGEVLRGVRVPRLVLPDGTVVEADDIADHLDAHHADPPLVPKEPAARAYCSLLEGWADAALGRAVRRFCWGPEPARTRAAERVAREIAPGVLVGPVAAVLVRQARTPPCSAERARERLREHVDVLDAMLGDRPFLLGRTMTRADVAAFAQLACARAAGEDVPLAGAPAVSAWLERLRAMPAIEAALVP